MIETVEDDNKDDVNNMIQELQDQEKEIDDELESLREEIRRPQRRRKPNEVLNIGSTKSKSYSNAILTQGVKPAIEYNKTEAVVLATIMISMVQTYSLKAGIKKFGKKGKDAAFTEMEQLHKRSVFKPRHPKDLTQQQKARSLESLIFITEKRDGRM